MKPQRLTIRSSYEKSFSSRRDTSPDINNNWHYHDELELIYFKKGKGTQFMGDRISSFSDGDILLAGSKLPHFWRFDDAFFNNTLVAPVEVYVVHFTKDFCGHTFLNLPEMKVIAVLLERSDRGIKLKGPVIDSVANLIENIVNTNGAQGLFYLLEALLKIALCDNIEYMTSLGFKAEFVDQEHDRIHAIYNYTITNYNKKINLPEIADIAKMSSAAFCRYFKSKTGKTYSLFANELRVTHACKLLIENKMNLKEISYDSGFNNFVSFHKNFKEITGMTPLKYQKTHR